MVRTSASFILEELAVVVGDACDHFGKEIKETSLVKAEILKIESMAFVFWFFQKSQVFSEPHRKLILDEVHSQYYDIFKKCGYDFEKRQRLCDEFNIRYQAYNKAFGSDQDLTKVAVQFCRFLSEKSRAELSGADLKIPLYLVERLSSKFVEWKNVFSSYD